MRIENEVKLDFSDVLLKPKRSTLSSRKDVSLERSFKFRWSELTWTGIPIISSNMTSVTTPKVSVKMQERRMLACLPKTEDALPGDNMNYVIPSVGLNGLVCPTRWVAVDVPNGYIESVVDFTRKLREGYGPSVTLIVGNVVTAEQVEALIIAGADIVKVGIGCFASGTRVLMANMSYKNIEDVVVGDRVINMYGQPTTVTATQNSGYKEVGKVEHVGSPQSTFVTPDHKFYMGIFDSQSEESLSAKGYKQSLLQQAKTTPKSDKIQWIPISEPERAVALLPETISWELPESFTLSIGDNDFVAPSYELGYIFGTFLGDGTASSSQLTWYFGLDETDVAEKLSNYLQKELGKIATIKHMDGGRNYISVRLSSQSIAEWFQQLGKKTEKRLPETLLCDHKEYLQGLFDGLRDSDGSIDKTDPRDSFVNTSQELIELYGLLHFRVLGYLPQFTTLNRTSLGEFSSDISKYNDCFSARSLGSPERRLLPERGLGIIKITGLDFDNMIVAQTWDIEVEDDTHSFIANNAIVHNSGAACKTRIVAGVGVPQLSAVIECADAAHGLGGHIISDGGCTTPGDIVKAFAGGADFVMLGGMLAGHDENGSAFYGMSSERANNENAGGLKDYRASEGWELELPHRGPIGRTLQDITGGLKSACAYVGARNIKELPKRATFIRVNNQANTSLWSHRVEG